MKKVAGVSKKIVLDGNRLTIKDINTLVKNPAVIVGINSESLKELKKVRQFLSKNMASQIIYGINTGFGPMSSHIIGKDQLLQLQENLIKSHAVGMGEPIRSDFVLAAMIVRLNTLVKGYSGATEELVLHLQNFINHRIIPVVPEHGAVGTSGDLVQLAHIALALIGEGEVFYKGKRLFTKDVLKECKIKPYILQAKEGLALINGTSVMSGISAMLTTEVESLLSIAVYTSGWSLEMANAFTDSFSEKIQALRPHAGQKEIAKKLRELLATSQLLQDRCAFNHKDGNGITDKVHQIPQDVQDVYSLRCTPQILGPIADSIKILRDIISIEINSVTDNPIIDRKNSTFLHGGNFHGDYIAYAVDQLKMTIVKLTMLSERRINYFLNQKVNRRFSPFINLNTPGITLGLQGLQFVATSTTANSQTLAFPQYVHSISTNADNQDVVSMGTDAALITAKVIENAFIVIAIEVLTLAQAVDYSKNKDKLSDGTKKLYVAIRDFFPAITDHRVLTEDLKKLLDFVKNKINAVIS